MYNTPHVRYSISCISVLYQVSYIYCIYLYIVGITTRYIVSVILLLLFQVEVITGFKEAEKLINKLINDGLPTLNIKDVVKLNSRGDYCNINTRLDYLLYVEETTTTTPTDEMSSQAVHL